MILDFMRNSELHDVEVGREDFWEFPRWPWDCGSSDEPASRYVARMVRHRSAQDSPEQQRRYHLLPYDFGRVSLFSLRRHSSKIDAQYEMALLPDQDSEGYRRGVSSCVGNLLIKRLQPKYGKRELARGLQQLTYGILAPP